MILLLDTSTPVCQLTFVASGSRYEHSWQADRMLARDLLSQIVEQLAGQGAALDELEGIGVMKGPGSFTGLRVGATVANTLARELQVSVVGASGDAWRDDALARLKKGESDVIVLPDYGRPARVTKPRK